MGSNAIDTQPDSDDRGGKADQTGEMARSAPEEPDLGGLTDKKDQVDEMASVDIGTGSDLSNGEHETDLADDKIKAEVRGDGIAAHTININEFRLSFGETRDGEKTGLSDPTSEFRFDEERILKVEEGLLTAVDHLRASAMLAIACDQTGIALSAAKHVTDHHEQHHQRSIRSYSSQDAEATPSSGRRDDREEFVQDSIFSLNTLLRRIDLVPIDSTILVDLTTQQRLEDARDFMRPFLVRDALSGFFSEASLALNRRRRQIIFLIPEAIAADPILPTRLEVWKVDAVKVVLAQKHCNDLHEVLSEVQLQIERGLWGKDPAAALLKALYNGDLQRRIEDYREYSDDKQQADEDALKELLQQDTQFRLIHEAVLFAGVYFPQLSEPHFERVVDALLGHDEIAFADSEPNTEAPDPVTRPKSEGSIPHPVSITINVEGTSTQPAPTDSHPKASSTAVSQPVSTIEVWRARARSQVVRDCRISLQTAENGRKYFAFTGPHMTAIARLALERGSPFHFQTYFPRVLDAGLAFDESRSISDGALQLMCEGMARAPDEYHWQWLVGWIVHRLDTLGFAEMPGSGRIEEMLAGLVIKAHQYAFVMSRLARLLQMLFVDNRLAKVARDLLANLINLGRHADALDLIRRLRSTLGLDTIDWLKRVLAQGSRDIRDRTTNYLVEYVRNTPDKLELIARLHAWLPDTTQQAPSGPLQNSAVLVTLMVSVLELRDQGIRSSNRMSLFPILVGQDLPDLPGNFSQAMALILYPGEHPTQLDLQPIVNELSKVLSGGIVVGESGKLPVPVLFVIVNRIRTSGAWQTADGEFAALIHFLLTKWLWHLEDVVAQDSQMSTQTFRKIADAVVNHLDSRQLTIHRNISQEFRRTIREFTKQRDRGFTLPRDVKKHFSRLNSISRAVSDALYIARKQLKASSH